MSATLWTIVMLHWAILVVPGPNVLLVAQLAADGQRRTALHAGLGIATVTVFWALLAALGVQSVFAAHEAIRRVAQGAGGLYLVWLALRLARNPDGRLGQEDQPAPARAGFKLGVVTNLLNPKSALFFASVFAATLPANPSRALLGACVVAVMVNALVWHFFLATVFSQPRILGVYRRQRARLNVVAGLLLTAFGIRLLWGAGQPIASPVAAPAPNEP